MSVDLAPLEARRFCAPSRHGVRAAGGDDAVPLKLVKVDRGDERTGRRRVFAAVRGAAGTSLPQAIYPLTHPALGMMEIFLVPIGPLAGGNGYQAIFT